MSFDKVSCFVPICDGCGPDWWQEPTYHDRPPHFHSKPAALRELRDTYGWEITRRIDGTAQMLCADCADKAECKALGCDWLTTVEAGELGTIPLCKRCGSPRLADVPPAGHPDSVTAELSDADEELLAQLDAETWPDDAELTDLPETLARLEASEES